MDFGAVADTISGCKVPADLEQFISLTSDRVARDIKDGRFKIIDLIKGLNTILTNSSYEVRSRGVELLVRVVTSLPKDLLTEKEIEVLTEFICLRLIDHRSMEDPSLRCLTYFVECDKKSAKFNKQIMEFIQNKASIHKMDARSRHKVYEILRKFVLEKKKITNTMDGEFIYSLVTILEGENNPDNLMLCFGIMEFILKNYDNLEPYIDDIFEWLSSYYPIDYTPLIEKDRAGDDTKLPIIHRTDLVDALYNCFYANDLNADNLQTLLLEKVDSNILSSQLESLECLIKCYEKPMPLTSITKYNSTLWTAIRMNCLKKLEAVDPKLLEMSLKTLTALARRLLEDKEMYLSFINDMYDELSIAFRKPEMDLFCPAARLVTHTILPSMVGFNLVLSKVLPISLNALDANEFRPVAGLAYMFTKLHSEHPFVKVQSDLDASISKLALKITELIKTRQNHDCVALLQAIIMQRVTLDQPNLSIIVNTLQGEYGRSNLDIEKCLALICSNYNQFDIINDTSFGEINLGALLTLVYRFEPNSLDPKKFSIYLRLLKIKLTQSETNHLVSLDQLVLKDVLTKIRDLLLLVKPEHGVVDKSATIHAILLNKLDEKNTNQICMSIFSSNYCQKLIPVGEDPVSHISRDIYLPHIKWIFKSLVLRNHQLATPLINLVLNCITSEKMDHSLAHAAAQVFSFVLQDDELCDTGCHYKVFSLYKQKFYMQTSKEIRLRLEQQKKSDDNTKKSLLIYALASQVAHLPQAAFKRDFEWLLRQLLQLLSSSLVDRATEGKELASTMASLTLDTYRCLDCLMHRDLCDGAVVSLLPSIIDLNLKTAQQAKTVDIRCQALACLAKVAHSFQESDLLVYRASIVDRLRACLADKKRLVRQAAGEARLRWVLIGQPNGSG